ncbi:MAG: TonB-dependent receptor [Ignavibacteriota bacterium]
MYKLSAFLATLFVTVAILSAQTPDTATIHGRVVDQSRAGVAGVSLTATNAQSGLKRTAESDVSGNFLLAGLPISGSYTVTASKQGFADASLDKITLTGDTSADLELQLNVAGGQSQITVTGVAGEVRADQPQLGAVLDVTQMDAMPLLGNKITNLPLLVAANRPAISQGDVFMDQTLFTTNGAGRRQAWFEVDGANAIDAWGRQTLIPTLQRQAVQEMDVLTNAFSAEYGGSTGSVINIISKSGGSQLHGEASETWRPSDTAAALSGFSQVSSNAAGNTLLSDTLGQSDVDLGGPIGSSGATHFFVAAEFSREDKSSPIISPIAPGVYVGHYHGWLGFFRLDHRLNDKNNLFFRGDVDAFFDTNPNGIVGGNSLPNVARVFHKRSYSPEVGETAVLSPRFVNNVRIQFQLADPITQFSPVIYGTQYSVPISSGGTFTSGTSQSALLINRQYEANDTISAVIGRHSIRFGAQVIVAHNGGNSKEFGGPSYLGVLTYNTCTQPLSFCESQAYLGNIANVRTYSQSYGNAAYTVTDTLFSGFVQDDIQVRRGLTVNLGLRYELQSFTDSRKNFAPRAGFAYNVGGDGKTVVRRIRHLLLAGGRQQPGELFADRPDRSLHLHRVAGADRIPHQRGRGTASRLPHGRRHPAAQPVRPPRTELLSESVLPHQHAGRLSERIVEPLFGAVEHRCGAPPRRQVGAGRRLRRLAHPQDQSAAGRRSAEPVRAHYPRTDAHSAGGELHPSLLDLVVYAEWHDLQHVHRHEPATAVFGDSERREQWVLLL